MPNPLDLEDAMRKYRRNLGHVRLTKLLRSIESDTNERGASAQAVLELITVKVKTLMDQIGIWADLHPSYLAYAFAFDKSQKVMEFRVDRIREWEILRDRWERRNLDPNILDRIDSLLLLDRP
ncbi:hypothetical protein ES703_02118 [subsurface metagenome]